MPMLYLLWRIVNIAIFLFFVLICFSATRFIRERFSLFASIIFVFGLLSFMGGSGNDKDNKEPNARQVRTWKFTPEDSLVSHATSFTDIALEKTLISQFKLGIKYGKDKQSLLNIPVSAYSLTTGFSSGTHWKPSTIIVNRTKDNTQFEYYVDAIVEWQFLGATVYSQEKEYKGLASIK